MTIPTVGEGGSHDLSLAEARSIVVMVLARIVPDLDAELIDRCESLHDVADIDSLDFLHLIALTAEATGVTVPPHDYPLVVTLDGFARYLAIHARPG